MNDFITKNKKALENFDSEFYNKSLQTTSCFSTKSTINDTDVIVNLKSFFNGIEQLTNSLLIIGLAIAMREALYLSLYECKCLGMSGENDDIHNENELYNKFISKVIIATCHLLFSIFFLLFILFCLF